MAISKIVYKSSPSATPVTWMDVTQKTVTSASMLNGTTALKNDGTDITGNIASKTSSDLTASNLAVTAPAGHYASDATKTLTDANLTAGNIKKDVTIFNVTGTYEGSGGGSIDDIVTKVYPTGEVVTNATKIYPYAFVGPNVTKVYAPYATHVCGFAFYGCTELTEVYLPECTTLNATPTGWLNASANGNWKKSTFAGCPKLQKIYTPKVTSLQGENGNANNSNAFGNTGQFGNYGIGSSSTPVTIVLPSLSGFTSEHFRGSYAYYDKIDLGPNVSNIHNNSFYQIGALNHLILRRTSALVTLGNADAGKQLTTARGVTIYIPKVFYDHLDDGTSSDYKAAANWLTYPNRTWAQIEGSYYETHYADGTEIPT